MTETQRKTLGIAVASLVLGCLFIIPLLGILCSLVAVVLGIVALVKINKHKETYKGEGLAIAGIVLGSVGILVIPVIALMAAIAIPNLLRARISANEAAAKSSLRTVSTAVETYVSANNGRYPSSGDDLREYLPGSFDSSPGYSITLDLKDDGYSVEAVPRECHVTGTREFRMQEAGEIMEKECQGAGTR
jgi:type IV pilus assembly protein PilA